MFLTYAQRNKVLKELGYNSYDEYLDSPLWAEIRYRVMKRDDFMCVLCLCNASCVHHFKYTLNNLNGKKLKHMYSVCMACHKVVEFDDKGRKLSETESMVKFERVLRSKKLVAPKEVRVRQIKSKGKPQIGLAHKRKHLARRRAMKKFG